jgi:hypothetical protein
MDSGPGVDHEVVRHRPTPVEFPFVADLPALCHHLSRDEQAKQYHGFTLLDPL